MGEPGILRGRGKPWDPLKCPPAPARTPGGPGGSVSPQSLSPVPGRGGSAGTLWLLGASPLLLILLICLGVLGRDGDTAGRGDPRAQPPPTPCPLGTPSCARIRGSLCGGAGARGRAVPAVSPVCVPAEGQVLQSGRFSAVWRGTLRQRPVVRGERAVHSLPLMEHENVARLLHTRAAAPRARGGLLVLQLYPAGSLRHFLGQHVGTWAGSVRLALSLARGLAFLPAVPCPLVVHRDLSSQNVLVREDGTCAIGDFGLALALPPRAQDRPGVAQAGTQRYLAPEILDESLDLRAWGRALRQADVYALGLLLWEILSRCQALSPGAPVPPFRLAYEAELGPSPSGAQLRRLAADERRRPLIPAAWHRTPQVRAPGRPGGRAGLTRGGPGVRGCLGCPGCRARALGVTPAVSGAAG
uniref:receptor protein serine/threonine kinase n=1 Tax=Geospiza parvula TaxID=87175 RepID=A0A8U8C6J5_GEOPR